MVDSTTPRGFSSVAGEAAFDKLSVHVHRRLTELLDATADYPHADEACPGMFFGVGVFLAQAFARTPDPQATRESFNRFLAELIEYNTHIQGPS